MEDLSDVKWDYTIGEPLTYDQMMAEKNAQRNETGPFAKDETNPYLFEDDPVDHHNFAVVSFARDHQHGGEGNIMKIRAVFDSVNAASEGAADIDTEKCDTFLLELYKFCILPLTPEIMAMENDERDAAMNAALQAYKRQRVESGVEYMQRKQTMMEDIKRQEETKARIRAGEIPEAALDSSCVVPEPVTNVLPVADPHAKHKKLKGDVARSLHRFCVITMIDMTDVNVDDRLKNTTFVKINGVFTTEENASKHAELLRSMHKYKHIDIYVAHLFEWLQCPPDSALISNVVYEQKKLNEALGGRDFTAMDSMEHMMDADINN